ncbi:phage head-binding domain-containing protein [Escherichia coli]|uniref:phage head-binding domain-containing protein n=1 Tax=Escherichia coli TaxID=562 RepID=UPI000B3ED8C3|nr:phage head-binding domain-containing protein [Escherichia coli]
MSDITANVVVSMPSQLFTMARSFKAVANGKIYIGKINTDPVNPENQIPVYVENEDGSHVPVSQPIIINAAGYPVYNGQIAKFVTVQGHSMAVYDAYGVQQFYFPNVLKYDPDQLRQELQGSAGAIIVGGAILECSSVEQAQSILGLTDGKKVRTYYYNVPVVTDWVFTTEKPQSPIFYISAVGGYLILMTPNFASAGIIEGEYVPVNAANNRNVIQALTRDTRFSKFSFGCIGKFYILGSIHPLRDDIEILHESGVTMIGRYDDPSISPDVMGINAGHMWGFMHFLNPDATIYDENNYIITAVARNINYILHGKIGTEFNDSHSKKHNNNPIGFYECENCSVVGSGGVICSDHRGINVDGAGDNCKFDISYITNTSNNPIQMKIKPERYACIRVGSVHGIKFDGGDQMVVAWCGGGFIDLHIGNYRWDGVKKPIIAYANACQELRVNCGIISGASQVVRQYKTPVCRLHGAWVNNTDSIINKAETVELPGVTVISEITGVYANDEVLTSIFFDETKLAPQDQIIIYNNNFRSASKNLLYFKGKTQNGIPKSWDVRNNLDPSGLVDFSDWNLLIGQENLLSISGTAFSYKINRRFQFLSVQFVDSGGTERVIVIPLRMTLSSTATVSYIAGTSNLSVTRVGDTLSAVLSAGSLRFAKEHN